MVGLPAEGAVVIVPAEAPAPLVQDVPLRIRNEALLILIKPCPGDVVQPTQSPSVILTRSVRVADAVSVVVRNLNAIPCCVADQLVAVVIKSIAAPVTYALVSQP